MPYEEARARLELGALAPRESERRARDLALADALFAEMQCPADRARVSELRG
jgi:hypothetical protein